MANSKPSYVKSGVCHSWGQSPLSQARTSSCRSVFGIFHLRESYLKPIAKEIKSKLSRSCSKM